MSKTRIYFLWHAMLDRCSNPNNHNYHHYGGRGIYVDKQWLTFLNFYNDMGDKPPERSLERINNDGPYCKENCKWATRSEQRRNSRR